MADRDPDRAQAPSTSYLAILVGAIVCAVALMMLFDLGPFGGSVAASDVVPFDQPTTVTSKQVDVEITVYAAKRYAVSKKHLRPVNVSVELVNRSAVPLVVHGEQQVLQTADGTRITAHAAATTVAAKATRKVVLTFQVPAAQEPRVITVTVGGRKTRVALAV